MIPPNVGDNLNKSVNAMNTLTDITNAARLGILYFDTILTAVKLTCCQYVMKNTFYDGSMLARNYSDSFSFPSSEADAIAYTCSNNHPWSLLYFNTICRFFLILRSCVCGSERLLENFVILYQHL